MIQLLILIALAITSFMLGRLSSARAVMPPATRGAIHRDQRRRRLSLSDVPRQVLIPHTQETAERHEDPSRAPLHEHWPDCVVNHGGSTCDMGPECGDKRITDAIGKLGDDVEPKRDWQAAVWSEIEKERGRG